MTRTEVIRESVEELPPVVESSSPIVKEAAGEGFLEGLIEEPKRVASKGVAAKRSSSGPVTRAIEQEKQARIQAAREKRRRGQ